MSVLSLALLSRIDAISGLMVVGGAILFVFAVGALLNREEMNSEQTSLVSLIAIVASITFLAGVLLPSKRDLGGLLSIKYAGNPAALQSIKAVLLDR